MSLFSILNFFEIPYRAKPDIPILNTEISFTPFAEYIAISKKALVSISKELTHSIALNGKYKFEFSIVTCWQSVSTIVLKKTPTEFMKINERTEIFKVFNKLEVEILIFSFVKVWSQNEQKLDAGVKKFPQFRHLFLDSSTTKDYWYIGKLGVGRLGLTDSE